jgi:hypothetical protein
VSPEAGCPAPLQASWHELLLQDTLNAQSTYVRRRQLIY